MLRRTPGSIVRVLALGAAVVLAASACSAEVDPKDSVTVAKLQPQSLFVNQPTIECPESPEAVEGQGAVPQAVCIVVKNSGEGTAAYAVTVNVQDKDENDIVYSQVVVNTPPIEAGKEGAAAVAAPGAEKIINDPTDAEKAAGAIPANEVRLNVTQVTRVPS
jgi:hypothetical protein